MGRHGGVVCAARVVMGPPPGLWRVHHTHTAVFSHATDVTSLRTTRTQGTVKRRYRVHTEPSLASNLCVTLPGIIASNERAKQRKCIKYNHLIANCLIFHNVHAQTRILHQLAQEGHTIADEVLARLSPYLMAHVNRFGRYTLDFARQVPTPDYTIRVGMPAV
jgi:Tn3 transposase DDE domain-containing protein